MKIKTHLWGLLLMILGIVIWTVVFLLNRMSNIPLIIGIIIFIIGISLLVKGINKDNTY